MRRSTDDRRACTVYSPRAELPRERLRAHNLTESRAAVYRRARRDLEALAGADDAAINAEAAEYVRRYPDHAPDHFSTSTRKRRDKARRALQPGSWGARLLGSIEASSGFSLHAEHLGLPAEAADPERLYLAVNVSLWLQAIRRHFKGPLYWRLELGEGRIHVHIVAAYDDGPPGLPRGGELVKPLHDPEGWIAYISKPNAAYTGANLGRYLKARRRGRLPRLSGIVGIPSRRVWGCEADRSGLRVSLLPGPQNAPTDRSPITAPALPVTVLDDALERVVITPPTAPRIGSEITTAQVPSMVCDVAGSISDQLSPPDRSKIRSITASEAECTSVTAYLPSSRPPETVFTRALAATGRSYPDRPKSATVLSPVPDGVSRVTDLSRVTLSGAKIARRADHLKRPAVRGPPYPLRRAESPATGPPSAATQTLAKSARALSGPRSSISRGGSAPRMEAPSMKQHPNRRRAAATAARSGVSVNALALMPPAKRAEIMAGLNDGRLVLITSPAGQFIAPSAPAEASGNG